MLKSQQSHRKEIWNDPNSRTKTPLGNSSYGLGNSITSRRRQSYNACLVLVDRYSKPRMFPPCHKDDTAMDTSIMIWNK
ncbi:hypothetical protein O181_120294, partial [Austropuccinia psidii MF-1]|nr:hypothetical protein [Austropuccinia psidii MF-1]